MAEAASAVAIELVQVTRRFGKLLAVDRLDLRVASGEAFAFLGPNGAGKTTTIRMLTGLLRPTSGELRVAGHDVRHELDAVRRLVRLVPDTPPVPDWLTGHEHAAFVASLYGVPARERDARIARLFAVFELREAADQLVKGYSFGMKKKLHIGAVLATAPRVLFLDEPTIGLDPRSARGLKDELLACKREGITIFLTTHLLDLALELCDRAAILDHGRLVAEGALDALCEGDGVRGLERRYLALTGTRVLGDEAVPPG